MDGKFLAHYRTSYELVERPTLDDKPLNVKLLGAYIWSSGGGGCWVWVGEPEITPKQD